MSSESFQEEVAAEGITLLDKYSIDSLIVEINSAAIATGVSEVLASNLAAISNDVSINAGAARLNAAYSGAHDDGGAARQMEKLTGYLSGVLTGLTGSVGSTSPYSSTLKLILRDQDPDYQKYLELKAKFGDK
jgi:hypothetical protein